MDRSLPHPRLREIAIPSPAEIGAARAVAIDFETASMSRATPCAIGVAWLGVDGVTHRAYRLIRPDCPERAWCFGYIHGLYPEDVAAAASFPELWDELAPHLEGALVLAHNAAFDLGVLRQTLDYYGLPVPSLRCLCTLVASRRVWAGMPSYTLPLVAERVGFHFDHHHALEDAEAAARIAHGALAECGAADFEDLAAGIGVRIGSLGPEGYVSSVRDARRAKVARRG